MSKKIGILTSGGDCAGLNAVIRAATLRAVNKYSWKVIGIRDGTLCLISNPMNITELKPKDFDGTLLRMGGTFLGTSSKENPFKMNFLSTFAERLLIFSISQHFLPNLFLQVFELLQQIPLVIVEELPYKNH